MVRKGKSQPADGEARGAVAEEDGEAAAQVDEDGEEVPVWVIDSDEDAAEAEGGEPAAGAAAAAASPAEAERLRRELAEVREQWVRALADLDNYRKRADREQREQRRYALFEPMRELLPVVDNLERALVADGSVDDLKRGVEMVLNQLKDVLRGLGVKPLPAAGAPFDPAIHDAVSRHEDETAEVPTVSDELQRGYTFHDRLLRPALVKVAMPAARPAPAGGAADDGEPTGEA